MKGYMYILECSDGSYYTGSTNNLENRIQQHQSGEGANHTKKRLPVKLVYVEEFQRIDEAFYREKQVQGWSRKKKEALIKGENSILPELSKSRDNGSLCLRRAQAPDRQAQAPDRQAQAPDRQAQAPDRQAQAPDRQAQAPDRQAQAPDRQDQWPNESPEM